MELALEAGSFRRSAMAGFPRGESGRVRRAREGSTEDIEAYYTDIRRGRPPSPEQLADLVRRYEAIGGISPLARLS